MYPLTASFQAALFGHEVVGISIASAVDESLTHLRGHIVEVTREVSPAASSYGTSLCTDVNASNFSACSDSSRGTSTEKWSK